MIYQWICEGLAGLIFSGFIVSLRIYKELLTVSIFQRTHTQSIYKCIEGLYEIY